MNALYETRHLMCDDVMASVNGFWFCLGWCSFFLPFELVCAGLLARYYKEVDPNYIVMDFASFKHLASGVSKRVSRVSRGVTKKVSVKMEQGGQNFKRSLKRIPKRVHWPGVDLPETLPASDHSRNKLYKTLD